MLTQALLVDDSRSVLDFLKRLIEAEGLVEVVAFTNPLEALASAAERDYDIVLVDYEMPKMDGITFIRKLRAFPNYADIPIAMITSIETDDIRISAL
ncbi:MAG: response regulator, partial [Bradyrhizobium sp.]